MIELKYVLVNVDSLRKYVENWHSRTKTDTCKADGQEWPCDTYTEMLAALDRPYMSLVVSDHSTSIPES